ncbi:hypothetical protein CTI12_AA169540 [Artemisia annua]|uniref:RING-CH-type domain-containing protein n=1 Tax=Artemisia annua TaxID=35608 RepID=A0A2U1PC82_ARTAN|nr:hypothetical protein CTI12_AA169540 [Artemisia annua]
MGYLMEDHLIECVDEPVAPQEVVAPKASSSRAVGEANDTKEVEEYDVPNEEEPLIQSIECRICQEEDSVKNLEVPCACSGSLKIVSNWPYELLVAYFMLIGNAYNDGAMRKEIQYVKSVISGNWTLAGTPLDLNDPRVLAMAAAERRLLETDYDEYEDNSASGASLCRSVAIILFMLRAAGFLLPCYIMLWGISILQRRRQAQEVETLAASDVAFMIQAGQHRGLQTVSALGSIGLALRWGEGRLFSRNSRLLKDVKVEELNTKLNIAPTPAMMFDPNQSNKRRIRRGSDPIHNTR